MKKILVFLVLAIASLSFAGPAIKPHLAWKFAGPVNPEYEWVTMSAAGGEMVYTFMKGKSWSFTTENGTFTETGSEVVALDMKTGQKRWSYNTQFPVLSPLLFLDGKLIIHDGYGNIFCLDASKGKEIWKAERELHPGSWDEETMPSGKDGFIYLREENELVCRGLQDGKPVWRTPIEAVSNRRVFPALRADKILLSTASDKAMCFNAKDGKVLWKKNVGWLKETVVASDKFAFFANADVLKCLSLADGSEVWTYSAPPMKSTKEKPESQKQLIEPIWNLENAQPLALAGDRIYVIQKRVMYPQGTLVGYEIACFEQESRKLIWTYSLEEKFSGFSLTGQGAIVIQGAKVTLLSLGNGSAVWEFQVPGEERLQGQALALDVKIFVVGTKGLYCIETGNPQITGWTQCGGSAARSGRIG